MSNTSAAVYISPSHYASLLSVIAVDNNNNNNNNTSNTPLPQSISKTSDSDATIEGNNLVTLNSPLDPFHFTFLTPLSTLNTNSATQPTSYVVHPFGSMAHMLTTASSWMFRTSVVYNATTSNKEEGGTQRNLESRPKSLLEEILLERQHNKQDGNTVLPVQRPSLKVEPFVRSEADARFVLRDILHAKEQQRQDEEEQRRLLHNKNIRSHRRRGQQAESEVSEKKMKKVVDPLLVNSEFQFGVQNAVDELFRRRYLEAGGKGGGNSRKRNRLND